MKWLYGLFHRFPRVDFSLKPAGNVFLLNQPDYLQGIAIWGGSVILLLLLCLLLLSLVWSWRCCKTVAATSKRYESLKRYSSVLFLLDLVCCVLVGLCLFSNEKFNRSVDAVATDLHQIGHNCRQSGQRANLFNSTLQANVSVELRSLNVLVFRQFGPQLSPSHTAKLSQQFSTIGDSILSVAENLSYVQEVIDSCLTVDQSVNKLARWEYERWSVALVLFCGILIVQFVGLVAFCRHSRSTAILFSVASLFTFTLNCLVISFALALSLGISDFCTQPRPFLHSTVEGNLSHSAIDFYLECRSDAVPIEHPLAKFESAVDNTVISMQKQLKVIESDLDTLKKSSQVHFHVANLHTHLNEALKNFGNIEELLSCDGIHTAYRKAFDGLCTSGLVGSSLLVLGSLVGGIFMLALSLMVSRTWQLYKRRRSGEYVGVEDRENRHDTSAVSADFYGTHVVNPRSRGDVAAAVNTDAEGPLWVRSSPPPAYESLQASRARNSRNAGANRSSRR